MGLAQEAHVPGPGRVRHGLQHAAQRRVRSAHARVGVAVACAGHRHVDGEHQGGDAGGLGPLQGVAHEAAILEHIELEPHGPVDGRSHFLDRADRDGGQCEGNALGRRRFGRLHLATAGVHAGQTDRCQGYRHGQLLAEQFGGQVQLGHVLQHALAQGNVGQVGNVALERVLGIGAAVDIVEQERRQLAPGGFAVVGRGGNDHGSNVPGTEAGPYGPAVNLSAPACRSANRPGPG